MKIYKRRDKLHKTKLTEIDQTKLIICSLLLVLQIYGNLRKLLIYKNLYTFPLVYVFRSLIYEKHLIKLPDTSHSKSLKPNNAPCLHPILGWLCFDLSFMPTKKIYTRGLILWLLNLRFILTLHTFIPSTSSPNSLAKFCISKSSFTFLSSPENDKNFVVYTKFLRTCLLSQLINVKKIHIATDRKGCGLNAHVTSQTVVF